MSSQNEMKLIFDARSVNESFARVAVAAFIAELNPTLDEIADIKTAVSEAVTNAIIHGYHEPEQKVELLCQICGDEVSITVSDAGAGIADVSKAMETSVYKGYKQDKIEMRGDRAEMSDFPLYLNTVAGGLDCRDQTIGGFSFVVKIYAVPVIEIIG